MSAYACVKVVCNLFLLIIKVQKQIQRYKQNPYKCQNNRSNAPYLVDEARAWDIIFLL